MKLSEIRARHRINVTIEHVAKHLTREPVVGTTPGFGGWPRLTIPQIEELESRPEATNWHVFILQETDATIPYAVVYGLNPQATWSVFLNGAWEILGAMEEPALIARFRASFIEVKATIEAKYGCVLIGDL